MELLIADRRTEEGDRLYLNAAAALGRLRAEDPFFEDISLRKEERDLDILKLGVVRPPALLLGGTRLCSGPQSPEEIARLLRAHFRQRAGAAPY